jgi:hypothetical protein
MRSQCHAAIQQNSRRLPIQLQFLRQLRRAFRACRERSENSQVGSRE